MLKLVRYVLLLNAMMHTIPFYDTLPIIGNMMNMLYLRYFVSLGYGLLFLLIIPFIGWVGEFIKRYKIILCGMVIVLVGFCTCLIFLCLLIYDHYFKFHYAIIPIAIGGLFISIGYALFEANSIQFGTDQIPGASSRQLKIFVRVYYWTTQFAQLVTSALCTLFLLLIFKVFQLKNVKTQPFYQLSFGTLLIGIALIVISLILFVIAIKHKVFEVHIYQENPFIKIVRILKYSLNHTYPEHRSAFTYWEEDVPARIDLAKHKYGGPFTNEEVEGVKSFFRILVLLLTLFGYQLAGDTFSVSEFIKQYGCPSSNAAILLIGLNPQHLSYIVVLVYVPLSHACRMHTIKHSLLFKMGLGLALSLTQEIASSIIGTTVGQKYLDDFANITNINMETPSIRNYIQYSHNHISLLGCFALNSTVLQESTGMHPVNVYYWWLVVPQLFSGVSKVMVFMTALEFICAQAPYSLQGMLIGIWHSTYSISFFIVGGLDTFFANKKSRISWYIYHGIKMVAILLSLLLYCCVAKHYRYRERTEVVNERWMIEEIWERNIQRREEYENNKLLLSGSSHINHRTYTNI